MQPSHLEGLTTAPLKQGGQVGGTHVQWGPAGVDAAELWGCHGTTSAYRDKGCCLLGLRHSAHTPTYAHGDHPELPCDTGIPKWELFLKFPHWGLWRCCIWGLWQVSKRLLQSSKLDPPNRSPESSPPGGGRQDRATPTVPTPPLILLSPHPVLHWLSVLKGLSQQRKSSQIRDQVRAGEIKWMGSPVSAGDQVGGIKSEQGIQSADQVRVQGTELVRSTPWRRSSQSRRDQVRT